MGYEKRPVNMTLGIDVVDRASKLTRDLSGTVEALLIKYVEEEEAKRATFQQQADQWVKTTNAFVERNGSPADDYVEY